MSIATYTEKDVTVRGLSLHYQEWGDPAAPSILMLHGFGVSGHMFDEFAQRMQKDYHLIALDQRGHGDSDWSPEGDYSRDAFVDDAEGFRQAVGLERFVLIGHSMGGLNAVAYTVRFPQRVRALILVDVGPESAREGVDNIVRFTRGPDELEFDQFVEMAHRFNPRRSIDNIRDRMRHRLKPIENGNGKFTWKFDRRFRQPDSGLKIGSDLSNNDSWQLFREVPVPTLLIRGAESDVLTSDIAARTEREMQKASLVVITAAGHSVPGDNPDDFTTAVQDFLGKLKNGAFEPASASEPPPLRDLVHEQEAARRRGASIGTLVLAGIGAALAVAGISFALKRRSRKPAGAKEVARARVADVRQSLPSVHVNAAELDAARQRAADVVAELSTVGRSGLARARRMLGETDVTRARAAASDVVRLLGEGSRQAPGAVKAASSRIDRKQMRRRRAKATSAGKKLGAAAVGAALAARKRAGGKKRRGLPWAR